MLTTILLISALLSVHPQDIDTRVGTAVSDAPDASIFGSGGEVFGNSIPCVTEPNGMTFWTPQTRVTEKKGVTPYYYEDEKWMGFRSSHWMVGSATQDYGSFYLLPDAEPVVMDHSREIAQPHYYRFGEYEMVGRSRSAILRLKGCDKIEFGSINGYEEGKVFYDERLGVLRGENPVHRIYQGWGLHAGFSGWITVHFNCPVKGVEYSSDHRTAILTFDTQGEVLEARLGTSFHSYDRAEANLQAEILDWDFEKTKKSVHAVWERIFAQIELSGGRTSDARLFYSSLWRASLLPRATNDVGEVADYDDFSLWDTFRALHPLITILHPGLAGIMVRALVDKYERGGWLPIFPAWGNYTSAMIGDHATSVLADAFVKGIEGFDAAKAYEAARKNAFETPDDSLYQDGRGRRALQTYMDYGYLPVEEPVDYAFHQKEQTSRTLEYAYDDWCVSLLAKRFGTRREYRVLKKRASNWKNVFDPATKYPQGRHDDGQFMSENNYLEKTFFITEGTPCHYSWFVPHDIKGLVRFLGRKEFEKRLDSMFVCKRYWHGNEPCHHVAYLYDWVGRRDKTASVAGDILLDQYRNTPGGLSGNDDAGQMSAWYVFSSLGFYPVCPGSGEYALGLPAFDEITIHLENGRDFRIKKESDGSSKCRLNDKTLKEPFLGHDAIMRGGKICL